MDKNTIWAIVLSTIIIVGFMFLQPILFPQNKAQQSVPEANKVETVSTDTKTSEKPAITTSPIESIIEEKENLEEKNYTITTDKLKITFTNRGGDIIDYELLEHTSGTNGIQMADNISKTNRAFAISFGDYSSEIINSVFNVEQTENKIEFSKVFSALKEDGTTQNFTLKKIYTFLPDEYLFKLDVKIEGIEDFQGYTLRTSPQIGPHYDRKKDRYEYRRFMSYTEGKQKKKQLGDNATEFYKKDFEWTGVAGKYFSVLVKPEKPQNINEVVYSTKIEKDNYANAQVMLERRIENIKNVNDTYYVYVGPQTEKSLGIYNKESENGWKVSSFKLNDSLSSSGILSWLEAILKWVMELMHDSLHINWGVSIIIMTILLKAVMFPLTKKSSIATLKMQKIQPQMQELQEKYKGNNEKLNMEMAKLYKEMGYNPLSGCLPMLLQFPLIIAMFNLFNNYFEFRGAVFIPGWIPDLSTGDSLYTFSFAIPFLGNQLRLLPIIYVFSQLLYGKLTQANTSGNSKQMKFMTYGMPLIFFFIFYNAPSGLILYWTVSNMLQLVQQIIINKMMAAKREELGMPEKQQVVYKKKKK